MIDPEFPVQGETPWGDKLNTALGVMVDAINLTDTGYDIVLVYGQSNNAGRGLEFDLTHFDPIDPRIFVYGAPSAESAYASVISQAVEPGAIFHNDGSSIATNQKGMGPSIVFARWLAMRTPNNRRILLVMAARGGTAFEGGSGYTWLVNGASGKVNLYTAAINQTKAALAAAGPGSRVIAAIWVQGESDGSFLTPASNYQADLDALIDATRADLGVPNLPIIVGEIPYESRTDVATFGSSVVAARQAIDSVHIDTPRRKQYTAFAYSPPAGNINSDKLHYNAAGQRIFGKNIYLELDRAAMNQVGELPLAPTGVSLSQQVGAIAVSWTRPYSRVTDYNVRYRIVGGAWIDLSRSASIDNIASIPGLTVGLSYEVQVRSVNEQGISAWSESGTITLLNVPNQVTGLSVGLVTASSVALSWNASSPSVTAYLVEKRIGAGSWSTDSTISGTSYTVTSLTGGVGYGFRVSAINVAGTGIPSSEVTATTTAPTVYASDDFNRANGALGVTPVGTKAWSVSGTGVTAGVVSNTAKFTAAGTSAGYAVFDSGQTDQTIRVKQLVVSTGHGGAIVPAYVDDSNNVRLSGRVSGSDFHYRAVKLVGGSSTIVATSASVVSADNDSYQIIRAGSLWTFLVNGVDVFGGPLTISDSVLTSATKVGFGINTASSGGDTLITFDDFSSQSA